METKNKIFKALLLLFLISGAATSNASTIGCFDCSASQSKSEAVKRYNSLNTYEAFIEVIDFKNNIVRSYTIEYDPESRRTLVMSSASTSSAKSTAANLTQKYNQLQAELKAVNHTNTEFDSAYSVIGDRNYLSVTNDYMAQANPIEKIGVYGGLVLSSMGKIVVNATVVIDIGFPDGSSMRFKISGIDSDHDIEFEIMEATDSENNDIPLNADQIKDRYKFIISGENWVRHAELRESFGVSASDFISLFENAPTGSTSITMICKSSEECTQVN